MDSETPGYKIATSNIGDEIELGLVEKIKVNIKEQAKEAVNLYSKMNFKKVYEVLELDLSEEKL